MEREAWGVRHIALCRSPTHPIYQLTNLPIYQSTNLPIYQSTNLPIYQSTNLPIYQSTNLPIYQQGVNHVQSSRRCCGGAHLDVAHGQNVAPVGQDQPGHGHLFAGRAGARRHRRGRAGQAGPVGDHPRL
ncbi:MAG: hypothetical protein CVU38_20465 [Chloroflexi bacterium HGW-Chloroflexi-1]|nr:MAG: hypothetical protein CVU38_20465 [Chloroflexi bacterium HGW-Chloroflexi-1]